MRELLGSQGILTHPRLVVVRDVPKALSPALNQVCCSRLLLFASVLVMGRGYRRQLGASIDPLLVLTALFKIVSFLWGQRLVLLCPVMLG